MARHSLPLATLWLVALFPICIHAQQTNSTVANVPEQYRLCEKDLDIEALQQQYGLIRVDASPTHAAMHPSWPTALITIVVNIAIFLWNRFTEHGIYLNRFVSFLLPFGITGLWFATFAIAQLEYASAGWISASLTTTLALLATLVDWFVAVFVWGDSRRTRLSPSWVTLAVVGFFFCVGVLEVAGVLAAVVQRFIPGTGYGTLAYDITNANGCRPRGGNDFSFLEQGVRSRVFSIIQLSQAAYSVAVVLGLAPLAFMRGRRMVKEMMLDTGIMNKRAFGDPMRYLVVARGFARFMQLYLPVASLVADVPLLLYGAIIATRGVPVAMSGSCMLVELSPRFGFLDAGVDLWWRVLVGAVGH